MFLIFSPRGSSTPVVKTSAFLLPLQAVLWLCLLQAGDPDLSLQVCSVWLWNMAACRGGHFPRLAPGSGRLELSAFPGLELSICPVIRVGLLMTLNT